VYKNAISWRKNGIPPSRKTLETIVIREILVVAVQLPGTGEGVCNAKMNQIRRK
jgi:hypothetical protein